MLKILNTQVYDLKESVIASGNAMRLEPVEYTDKEFENGLVRMRKLIKASEGMVHCHKNALCGIRVSFDIVYPQYWTVEAERYHFLDIVTSASKMHRLLKMDLDKACNMYVDQSTIDNLQAHINAYNAMAKEPSHGAMFALRNTRLTTASKKDALYHQWMRIISNCPMGLELFERCSTNYLQLANIYWQRKDHKLREWHIFCKWIESLPYAKELIIGDWNNEDDY